MEELIYHIPPLPEGIRKVPHANQLFEKISFGKVREERISSRALLQTLEDPVHRTGW